LLSGLLLVTNTSRSQTIDQQEKEIIALSINPVVDLHFYIKSLPVDGRHSPEAFTEVVEKAAEYQSNFGSAIGWGLVEPLLSMCETAGDIERYVQQLPERFRLLSGEIVHPRDIAAPYAGALAEVAPVFKCEIWPDHEQMITDASDNLERLIGDHGVSVLAGVVRDLGFRTDLRPLLVFLVAEAPPPYGSTSSSRGIGVRSFVGISDFSPLELAEIAIHEAIHALDLRSSGSENALNLVRQKMRSTGIRPNNPAFRDIPHAIIFVQANETVRRLFDDTHPPFGPDHAFCQRSPETAERVATNWRTYLDGSLTQDQVLDRIVAGLGNTGN